MAAHEREPMINPDERASVRKQRLRRVLRYLLVALAAAGGVLFFLFISASANTEFFERNYRLLLGLNGALLLLLFGAVVVLCVQLWQRRRAGKFGTRLMGRLALWFALIGVLPGAVIYAVSVQFLARSLESWFNVKVDSALEAGLNLGRNALDNLKSEVTAKASAIASDLGEISTSAQGSQLVRAREQAQIAEAVLFNASGRVLSSVGNTIMLAPRLPEPAELARVRAAGRVVKLEGEVNSSTDPLRVRVIVPVETRFSTSLLSRDELFLQVTQPIPPGLAVNAEVVQEVSREYRQLALARQGLRQIYGITLTMTLLLAVFASVVAALLLAQRFAKPLQVLAEGTRAVASGDYRPLPASKLKDEIGALTQSFNQMTQQLHEARQAVQLREAELARTNQYLERLLANISAGVLVFDGEFRLLTANEAAEKILAAALREHAGTKLLQIAPLHALAEGLLAEFAVPRQEGATWQHQFDIERDQHDATQVLLARGSRLEMAEGTGYVVVFDDITAVMSGQRALAWSEVARRLAHEIKNPLTPIQLSAERLEMKLAPKLPPEDVPMLRKSTGTIVAQVEAMKRMVNEFRDYARMPPAELRPVDLNAMVEEVVSLYGQEEVVQLQLQPHLPWIQGDATHLRQVIHNLVLNALDSVRSTRGETALQWGDVVIRTKALEYALADGGSRVAVRLEVQDKGSGFSPKILSRAFEPYVTTKPKGTGLGLAIVRKIVDEHEARIELANVEPTKKSSDVNETAVAVAGRNVAGALVCITFTRLAAASDRG